MFLKPTASVPSTVQDDNVPLDGVPRAGVTKVGEVAKTLAPVPVFDVYPTKSKSQLAALVPLVKIQVQRIVVAGITVPTKLEPLELTVKLPVELFSIK
jgi:hypothetical protein